MKIASILLLVGISALGQTSAATVLAQVMPPSSDRLDPRVPRHVRNDQSTGPTNPNPSQIAETVGTTRESMPNSVYPPRGQPQEWSPLKGGLRSQ